MGGKVSVREVCVCTGLYARMEVIMNSAKKIMKNQGMNKGKGKNSAHGQAGFLEKNKMLLIIGALIMALLVGVVCYINLRPRAILTVEGLDANGNKVTNTIYYKEAMYDIYTAEQQYNSLSSLYEQFYGSTFWTAENVDGKGNNGSESAKKEIMKALKKREILYMDAVKNGISLTDDEKKKVEEDLKTFRDGLSDKQKDMFGLGEGTVRTVLEKQALADKYKEQIIAELNIDEAAEKAKVSKEDYRQYDLQYYTIEKQVTDEEGNSTAKSDKELKKAKKDMEALRKTAVKAKDFTKDIIKDQDSDGADDETGISYSTEELLATDTDFASEKVLKEIKKMKNDAISEVLEDDDAYYVVKMVNNNNSEAYENQCTQAVQDAKDNGFNAKYNEIKSGYTAKAQSFWKGRVTIGYLTYDENAGAEEDEDETEEDSASGSAASGSAAE